MFKRRIVAIALGAVLGLGAFGAGTAEAAVTQIEGSAGGGIVPWALMHPTGPLVSYTNVNTNDYQIQSVAVGTSIAGMVEISLAKQMVNAPTVGAALALDNRIDMTTVGLKVKLLDMGKDNAVPQVAIGVQSKKVSGDIVDALKAAGAIDSLSGTDVYVAATKFVTVGAKKVVLNGTLRATKANQFGVLGFGGGTLGGTVAAKTSYKAEAEISVGAFVADNVVLGVEYRAKPNNINSAAFGIKESAAGDLFMAYFVNKNMAITAAYAYLGQVGPTPAGVGTTTMAKKQDGLYLQLQAGF